MRNEVTRPAFFFLSLIWGFSYSTTCPRNEGIMINMILKNVDIFIGKVREKGGKIITKNGRHTPKHRNNDAQH